MKRDGEPLGSVEQVCHNQKRLLCLEIEDILGQEGWVMRRIESGEPIVCSSPK